MLRAFIAGSVLMWAMSAHGADAPPTAAPYATAHAAPLDPKDELVAATDAYVQYRVEFNGIKGGRVPAFLYVPKDARPQHPAMLLQYGSGGNKRTNYIVILGQQYVQRGYVVLTIDAPGRGERKAKQEKSRILPFDFDIDERWMETLGDYSRAMDYLTSRKDVDARRLAFVGISWGAITGITFAAYDPRIKVVASIVGGGGFVGWLPPLLASDLRRNVDRLDPVHHVAKIAPRPLLLLNATRDVLVPKFFADPLHKAAGDHATKIWLDTDHIFSTVDRVKVGELVIDFVTKNLEAEAKNPPQDAALPSQ